MVDLKEYLTRYKFLTPLVLATAVFLAVWFVGYLVSAETKTVAAKRVELAELQRDFSLLDKLSTEQRENEQKIRAILATLPESFEDVAFFVSQVERIATEVNQTLETQIDQSAKKETVASSLKFALKTEGGYNAFSQMMSNLANLPYHTRVDSIKIEEAPGGVFGLVNFRLYILGNE